MSVSDGLVLGFDAGPLLPDEANDVIRRSADLQLLHQSSPLDVKSEELILPALLCHKVVLYGMGELA